MLKLLYTLNQKYKEKKLFVWNVNRNSMEVFAMLAFRRFSVEGFVSSDEEYAGQTYMGRKIYLPNQIKSIKNAVIILADEVEDDLQEVLEGIEYIAYSEALILDYELFNKKIVVYGIGKGADEICCLFEEQGMQLDLFVVSKKKDAINKYRDKSVIAVDELEVTDDMVLIVSPINKEYQNEIINKISVWGIKCDVYIREYMSHIDLLTMNFVQSIESALNTKKKIFIFGRKNLYADLLKDILKIFGGKVDGYIHFEDNLLEGITSVYSFMESGSSDKFVIISEFSASDQADAIELMEEMGFSLEELSLTATWQYLNSRDFLTHKINNYPDSLVGYSIKKYENWIPGWAVYGPAEKGNIKILVLGGSTSSEGVLRFESWVKKFYRKLKENSMSVTIYNGAHCGNDITDEILRLLRDGYYLHPDIIISMSGVNNSYRKGTNNEFNSEEAWITMKAFMKEEDIISGITAEESLYSFWVRNQKVIKIISDFLGAKYIGFLQPMNMTMEKMDLKERAIFERERGKRGAVEFGSLANEEDGYINLMRMFEHTEGMFVDAVHYSDEANKYLASKVCEILMPEIERIIKENQGERRYC